MEAVARARRLGELEASWRENTSLPRVRFCRWSSVRVAVQEQVLVVKEELVNQMVRHSIIMRGLLTQRSYTEDLLYKIYEYEAVSGVRVRARR